MNEEPTVNNEPIEVASQPQPSLLQRHKKPLIIAAVGLAVAVVAALVIQNILSYHRVYIDLSDDISSAAIHYKGSNDEPANRLTTLNSDGYISIQNGEYLAVVSGERVDSSVALEFKVDSTTSNVALQPNLSRKYLDERLADEGVAINDKIVASLGAPELIGLSKGQLVSDGSWYVGIIAAKSTPERMKVDQYKIVLHNAGDGWYVAANQAMVFSYADFPDIPREVIQFANRYEI
jgi:hypothetical protein